MDKLALLMKEKREKEEAEKKALEEKLKKELPITQNNFIIPVEISNALEDRLKYFDEIIAEKDIADYLKDKAKEIYVVGMQLNISIGKICEEVYLKLGKKGSKDGTYLKWLDFVGIAANTARRHRKRYVVWNSVPDNIKPMITLLSNEQIEKIYKSEELLLIISETKNTSISDIENLIAQENNKNINPVLPNKHSEIDFSNFDINKFSSILENIESFPNDKKDKLYKLLNELSKLIDI